MHGSFVDREIVDAAFQCSGFDVAAGFVFFGKDVDVVLYFVAWDKKHGAYQSARGAPLLGYFIGGRTLGFDPFVNNVLDEYLGNHKQKAENENDDELDSQFAVLVETGVSELGGVCGVFHKK